MIDSNKNDDALRRKLIRLAVLAVVAAGIWIYDRTAQRTEQISSIVRDNTTPSANEQPTEKRSLPATSEQQREQSSGSDAAHAQPSIKSAQKSSDPATATESLVVEGLVLRDESGKVIYRGPIDLQPTLERIAAGKKLRFSHDGTTFQNREGRLPRQGAGYYREWVVPTPGESGPGPQRLVTGHDGDVWYTSDHYRSFRRIAYDWPKE